MTDATITALTANTTPAVTDIIPMVDDPSGSPLTQKITLANLWKVINSFTAETTPATDDVLSVYDTSEAAINSMTFANFMKVINVLTAKTSLANSDTFVINDSAASNAAKSITWSNVMTAILAYTGTFTNKTLTSPVINSATGIGQSILLKKAADEAVTNSTTLQNDDHFSFAIAANEVWFVELWLSILSVNTTNDFQFAFTTPASCVMRYHASGTGAVGWAGNSTASAPVALITTSGGAFATSSDNLTHGLPIQGIFFNSTNAGTIQFQWAQNTGGVGNTTTVQQYSIMRRTRIA